MVWCVQVGIHWIDIIVICIFTLPWRIPVTVPQASINVTHFLFKSCTLMHGFLCLCTYLYYKSGCFFYLGRWQMLPQEPSTHVTNNPCEIVILFCPVLNIHQELVKTGLKSAPAYVYYTNLYNRQECQNLLTERVIAWGHIWGQGSTSILSGYLVGPVGLSRLQYILKCHSNLYQQRLNGTQDK